MILEFFTLTIHIIYDKIVKIDDIFSTPSLAVNEVKTDREKKREKEDPLPQIDRLQIINSIVIILRLDYL